MPLAVGAATAPQGLVTVINQYWTHIYRLLTPTRKKAEAWERGQRLFSPFPVERRGCPSAKGRGRYRQLFIEIMVA